MGAEPAPVKGDRLSRETLHLPLRDREGAPIPRHTMTTL